MYKLLIIFFTSILNLIILIQPIYAGEVSLEGRIGRLERILANQTGSELLVQLQQMQTELQELRGMLEAQRFEIEQLKRQQRAQFLDIDARLGARRILEPSTITSEASTANNLEPPSSEQSSAESDANSMQQINPAENNPVVIEKPSMVKIPALPTPETTGASERDTYSKGFSLLKERKYDEAKVVFNDILQRYPKGEFADNSHYWLGETAYLQREYSTALAEFERLVQSYPNSSKIPAALLKIGYIYFDQKDFERARASFENVIKRVPNSIEARLAQSRLEQIKSSR